MLEKWLTNLICVGVFDIPTSQKTPKCLPKPNPCCIHVRNACSHVSNRERLCHQVSLLQHCAARHRVAAGSERGSCWADYHAVSYCSGPPPPLSLSCPPPPPFISPASACPRNKVVPSNCSNGVASSLDSWPWLCVIRVGQRGLEVAREVSCTLPVNSQYHWLNLLTLSNPKRLPQLKLGADRGRLYFKTKSPTCLILQLHIAL